jgi:hypothetical protein
MELVLVILVNGWLVVVARRGGNHRWMELVVLLSSATSRHRFVRGRNICTHCETELARKSSERGTADFAASTRHPESLAESDANASFDSQSNPMQTLRGATGTQIAKRGNQFSMSECEK